MKGTVISVKSATGWSRAGIRKDYDKVSSKGLV